MGIFMELAVVTPNYFRKGDFFISCGRSVLLQLSKHLALQLQTFVFLCFSLNRCEMTYHLITREMEPFCVVAKDKSSHVDFLFSPFTCWHLEVFIMICENSFYYRVINTLPDTLL